MRITIQQMSVQDDGVVLLVEDVKGNTLHLHLGVKEVEKLLEFLLSQER